MCLLLYAMPLRHLGKENKEMNFPDLCYEVVTREGDGWQLKLPQDG